MIEVRGKQRTAPIAGELEGDDDDSGCQGLLNGFAQNLFTGKTLSAVSSTKADGPFICRECFSDAVVRKCAEKRDHFAHTARLSPVLGSGESVLHAACKEEICLALHTQFPNGNWAVERPIPAKGGVPQLVPDISGRVNDERVAIEVQASTLTIPRIIERSQAYAKRKVALVWLVPLSEALGEEPFRPRLYERYLHSMYFGRTYYWWAGLGSTVKAVHYDVAVRHIEAREWYEDGELVSAGGYDKPYRTIKKPLYGSNLGLGDNFHRIERESFTPENERKAVPTCLTWQDRLPHWWSTG